MSVRHTLGKGSVATYIYFSLAGGTPQLRPFIRSMLSHVRLLETVEFRGQIATYWLLPYRYANGAAIRRVEYMPDLVGIFHHC